VVDNVLGKLYLVVYADPQQPDAFRTPPERLERLRARLVRLKHRFCRSFETLISLSRRRANLFRVGFMDAVRRSKEYIFRGRLHAGEISQRTSRPFERRRCRYTGIARAQSVAVHVLFRFQ